MIQCQVCESDTRRLEATIYVCQNDPNYVVHDFGLEQLLKSIGINNRTIRSIYRQISTNNANHVATEKI